MIEVQREGAFWTLTINRPEKANSLTSKMLSDLRDAVWDAQDKAQALLLTGRGNVFSAGADLEAAKSGLATDPVWEELSGAIAELQCLTIAALNGTVAGGAFGMVLACDLRIAVPDAKFFYPVMKLGFLPQPSDPERLAALVGSAGAKSILMAGKKLAAEDALRIGLVDEIVTADKLLERGHALAFDALTASPDHVAAIKRMIR